VVVTLEFSRFSVRCYEDTDEHMSNNELADCDYFYEERDNIEKSEEQDEVGILDDDERFSYSKLAMRIVTGYRDPKQYSAIQTHRSRYPFLCTHSLRGTCSAFL
jgi:hypothetical protein